ncbi:MAG TPA: anthranilate synthase component I [Candidatus Avacidaminococcus intestinavium]|uniref:Anthranilate synthase component 1 n=1 Tax=Candidatus Avacidaminococcus intestinavium TaxID=2840684 RepID=A0A9D1SLT2_9FIRM|nr:anthranilate synthase component I [Candidatus Avacidaminococcus intestinavium]
MLNLSLEEVKKFSEPYQAVPVMKEILLDLFTPIGILSVLKERSQNYFLLESVEGGKKWGRYSFIGYDPVLKISIQNNKLKSKAVPGYEFNQNATLNYVRDILKGYKTPCLPNLPPFTGGLVGYFAYEFFKYCEPDFNFSAKEDKQFQDIDLMLFDKVIAFDHLAQKIKIIAHVKLDQPEANYRKAEEAIDKIIADLQLEPILSTPGVSIFDDFKSNLTKEQYLKLVEKGQEYIRAGDIFQVVLSQQLTCNYEGSLLNVYRCLRTINPSQYMVMLKNDDVEIAASSPETLVKVKDNFVTTMLIAGTRPRGNTEAKDLALEQELLADEKEVAEHNMLVDLGRNDIGRVSAFNSVRVLEYKKITRFSHVMHIASQVRGRLAENKDGIDALCSVFPAGTLTGAPKIRACEIIDELEPTSRGLYGGSMGYLDFSGNLDLCITIRTLVLKNKKIFVQAGAGIVADSVPENEYYECLNKAGALIKALQEMRKVEEGAR